MLLFVFNGFKPDLAVIEESYEQKGCEFNS